MSKKTYNYPASKKPKLGTISFTQKKSSGSKIISTNGYLAKKSNGKKYA